MQQYRQRGFTLLELVVVVIVISILGLFALDRIWSLRVAAEQAAVSQVVGNIRSALGMEVSRLALAGKLDTVAKLQSTNPMRLLTQTPHNYIGEKNKLPTDQSGIWYYNKNHHILVYAVQYSEHFETRLPGKARIRFRIKLDYADRNRNGRFDVGTDNIGGLDLVALEPYRWTTTQ